MVWLRGRADPARRAAPRSLLIPLAGHTNGHSAIALRSGDGWLLHCGDAYFHREELSTPPDCPPGLRFFQNLNNADLKLRLANQERLRELAARHGEEITFLCSHDPVELEREQAKAAASRTGVSEPAPEALWHPSAELIERSRLSQYMRWLAAERGKRFSDYEELWRWSVEDLEGFWASIWDYFEVRADGEPDGGPRARDARRPLV